MRDVSLEKSPDGTFITCWFLKWYLLNTDMNKCGIFTMRNLHQIYNFKENVGSSKLYEKYWEQNNSKKIRNPKSEEKLGRR